MKHDQERLRGALSHVHGRLQQLHYAVLSSGLIKLPHGGIDAEGGNALGALVAALDSCVGREALKEKLQGWVKTLEDLGTAPWHLGSHLDGGADANIHEFARWEAWTREDWEEWEAARDQLQALGYNVVGDAGMIIFMRPSDCVTCPTGGQSDDVKPRLWSFLRAAEDILARQRL